MPVQPGIRSRADHWQEVGLLPLRPVQRSLPDGEAGREEELRGRGVGTALYGALSEHARGRGKAGLVLEVLAQDESSLAWVQRRAFVEVERQGLIRMQRRRGSATPDQHQAEHRLADHGGGRHRASRPPPRAASARPREPSRFGC